MSWSGEMIQVWLWGIGGVFVYEALRYYRIYVQREQMAQRITFYPTTYVVIFIALSIAIVLANAALGVSLAFQAFINGYALPSGLGALIGKTRNAGEIVEDLRVSDERPRLTLREAIQYFWY